MFDFMKLLDPKLPFRLSASLNIILRPNGLTEIGKELEGRMNSAINQAKERLGINLCKELPRLWLVVCEIPKDGKRRHWYFDGEDGCFKRSDEPVKSTIH